MGIYRLYLDTEYYPNGIPRCLKMERGDSIYVLDSTSYNVGDKYKNYNAVVTEIVCNDKKWWQFWKKKPVHGYMITFE